MQDTPYAEPLEHCVMCGALTAVPVSMPIEDRQYYEAGCGQLCSDCYKKLNEFPCDEEAPARR